jgi:hypothetical protein
MTRRQTLGLTALLMGTLALAVGLGTALSQPLAGAPFRWLTPLLQLALFAPLFVITALLYRQQRPRRAELMPELTGFLGVAVTLVDGYLIAWGLVALGFLPKRESLLVPPAWMDWAALLLIYGAMIFFGWQAFRRGGWAQLADALNIPYRRMTLLLLLAALALAAWLVDGYAAASLLALPAYAWPWIEPRASLPGKLLNTALAALGLAPVMIHIGLHSTGPLARYLPLGAAYGIFSLTSTLGFIVLVALGVRFAIHGWREA